MKKPNTNETFKEMRKSWQSYALMAPFFLLFSLFTLIPVLIAIILSFTQFNIFTVPDFVGWDNYIRMILDDDIFLIAIKNTFIFAVVTGPISFILCFFFAWIINDYSKPIRSILTVLFYAPVLSGQVYTIWKFVFSADAYGLLNGFLMKFGFINEPIGWFNDADYVLPLVIFVQLWLSFGTGFLTFIAGLQGVDGGLYEAGSIDGISNRFQEMWYITLPCMKSQLLFAAIMQIVSSFSVSAVPEALAGFPSVSYSAETIVTHIKDYGNIRYEMGYACALATALFIFMVITKSLITKVLNRVGK